MHVVLQRVLAVLSPSIFIVSNILLFGPFTVYQGNINELVVPFTSILSIFLFPGLILVSVLSAIGLLLPKELHRRYISILFILGILIWLQGNVLVWKYGLLDGQGIEWAKNVWRGWVDGTLWVLLLITAYLFYRQTYKIAAFASGVMVSLQLVFLVFMSVQKPEIWKEREKFSLPVSPPQEIFQFSSKQNIIQVMLDSFQSDIFQEIIDEEADHYYTALEGFTFFKETTGSFPTTKMSIPAIFSGQNYQNDITMPKFRNNVLKGRTITNVLYDCGYEVDFVNIRGGRCSNIYYIPTPYGVTKQQYEKANSALILDLVLFRYAPHFIKKSIYNNQEWLIQRLLFTQVGLLTHAKKKMFYYFSSKAFLNDIIANISVNRGKPVYKFFLLFTTHYPIVVDKDCEYAGKTLPHTRENTKRQCKCSLDHFIEFLNKLKLIGIYESSLIILQADTGAGQKVKMKNMDTQLDGDLISNKESLGKIVGSALPLMAIKPPNCKGPLNISEAQTTLTDIPATISSILNLNEKFNGQSVFEIDPNEVRERKFYYYKWRHENWQDDYFDHMDEFIIKGSVFDRASWRSGLTYHSPAKSLYKTEKIDFGTNEATSFKRFGWGGNEEGSKKGYTFNWALGSSASIFLSLPKNKAVLLTANVKSLPFSKSQHITIKMDGKEIGSWELSAPWNLVKHSIVIEPDEHRPDVSVAEFFFSQHRSPEGDLRPLAVQFESLTLSELTPY